MLKITKQQLNTRYDSMPQNLKEFLFSETNSNLLWAIGEANHLSDDKKANLATVVGDVVLGFIHPDDLSKHIAVDLNIDARLAQTLGNEIEKKIFYPVIQDLRENYRAIGSETPSFISDISKPEQSEIVYSEFEPDIDLKKASGEKELGSFFSQLNGKPMPGQEKIEGEQKIIEQAPAIIHKEEEIKATSTTKTSFGGLMGIFKGTGEKKPQAEAVMAEVQFGNQAKPIEQAPLPSNQQIKEKTEPVVFKPSIEAPTQNDQLRVVHYSDLRTPVSVVSEIKKEEKPVVPAASQIKDNLATPVSSPLKTESPINIPLAAERKETPKREINLDHFGGNIENKSTGKEEIKPQQKTETGQGWKPGGVFGFLKKKPTVADNIAPVTGKPEFGNMVPMQIMADQKQAEKKQPEPGIGLQSAVINLQQKMEKPVVSNLKAEIKPEFNDKIPEQPKIVNFDGNKISKEEPAKTVNAGQITNLPVGVKDNKQPASNLKIELNNEIKEKLKTETKKSGGFFGFFKKKPKLVEVNLNLTGGVNDINLQSKTVVKSFSHDNQQLIQKPEIGSKQVDYAENTMPSPEPIVNEQPEIKPFDKPVSPVLTQDNLQQGNIKKIEMAPARANIENIQLKDLPVHDDTIDLRNL